MREAEFKIETADGVMDTFFCHPDEGGPWCPVLSSAAEFVCNLVCKFGLLVDAVTTALLFTYRSQRFLSPRNPRSGRTFRLIT